MSDATINHDSEDLEALFDSIAKAHTTPKADPAPATQAAVSAPTVKPEVSAAAKPVAAKKGKKKPAAAEGDAEGNDKLINQIGHLTRSLHENLRALGYDKDLEKAAAAIPDARDRLAYVAKMTQQAADRVLNATDLAKPCQDRLSDGAKALSARWDSLMTGKLSVEEFKQLAGDTRGFLAEVPRETDATSAQLMEIIMAQDFQDLTGQVIQKVTKLVQDMEQQLLQFLLENMPTERRPDAFEGLLNGPVVNAHGRTDVVTSQAQVDDLLASLGF